ncbi:MAG TPA: plasmid maintenance system antidote protein [Cyclobacteriaceae bacterium]|nr:plasmid maintenance system antidote protein [Cyclobacteriaceae bacterium]
MNAELTILKGIHPGVVLERKLKERKLAKGAFAISINEYPQTLGAITKGRRGMNTPLALKIESALGLEEGYFMTLQVFYEIKEEKRKQQGNLTPELTKLRRGLFWDTDINNIDWQGQKAAVIERVLERGNRKEKAEIIRFYGKNTVEEVKKKTKK